MTVIEPSESFKSSVEIGYATSPPDLRKPRRVRRLNLAIRFRDFLGEPMRDTGPLEIRSDLGTLAVPGTTFAGREFRIEEPASIISETGELHLVLDPENDFGKATVKVTCRFGDAAMNITFPAPSGFALAEMMESVVYAFLVAIIIRIFFFQTFWIPSGSMEPTLYEGDRIIANKLVYHLRAPVRGEVIIFRVFQPPRRGIPGRLTLEEARDVATSVASPSFRRVEADGEIEIPEIEVQDYIKRVVGLPGDVVEVLDGEIYVNGDALLEDFPTRPPDYSHYGPITVPPGEVFVLGDNRSNSQDSHVIGPIPIRNIEGRAEVVFWPMKRVGLIPQGG